MINKPVIRLLVNKFLSIDWFIDVTITFFWSHCDLLFILLLIFHLLLFVLVFTRIQLKPRVKMKRSTRETGDTHTHVKTHLYTPAVSLMALCSAVPRISSRDQSMVRRAGSRRRRSYWPASRRSSTESPWRLRYSSDLWPVCLSSLTCLSLLSDMSVSPLWHVCLRRRRGQMWKLPLLRSYWSTPQRPTAATVCPDFLSWLCEPSAR